MWSGPNIDFNLFFEKYNSSLNELLQNVFLFNNIELKVKLHGFISDTPARSKALNMINFNGAFGCTMCLHPTIRNSANTCQIYPVMNNVKLRTKSRYTKQLRKSLDTNTPVKGVKGFSYLSNLIEIPNGVLFDYMHMSLIGTFKSILNILLDSKNKKKEFYLGEFNFINNSPFLLFEKSAYIYIHVIYKCVYVII